VHDSAALPQEFALAATGLNGTLFIAAARNVALLNMPRDVSPGGPVPIPYPNAFQAGASASPPPVSRQLPRELLPADFQTILSRLQEKYGSKLNVIPSDAEWVEVSVENVPAAQLHADLQNARNVLFGDAEPRVQVIQPLRPTGAGIFLHLLSEPNWSDIARLSGK
jgi:hypothetical protein